MDAGIVAGRFRDKSILITGSTGFLGKMLVEKILRVQPEVRKLYLLVRAPDAETAQERILTEKLDSNRNVLFINCRPRLLEKVCLMFCANNTVKEKICPLAGDVMHENFGLGSSEILQLSQVVDIIVNGAATTNFMESTPSSEANLDTIIRGKQAWGQLMPQDSFIMGHFICCQFKNPSKNARIKLSKNPSDN
uniref:Fatty acyl-CoA reductase n=1 Tax=Leersia perrieri TaxID=77586 RepID=A0A0D9W3T0_9ORYZ